MEMLAAEAAGTATTSEAAPAMTHARMSLIPFPASRESWLLLDHLGLVEAPQQPGEDALERVLPVRESRFAVADAVLQDGDGDALVAARQEHDLVVDPAGAESPACLRVRLPALRSHPEDPPALRARDVREQVHRVAAMPLRDELVDLQHEARLVGRIDARATPDLRVQVEPVHRDLAGQRPDAARADVAEDRVRGVVARARDHRVQEA